MLRLQLPAKDIFSGFWNKILLNKNSATTDDAVMAEFIIV